MDRHEKHQLKMLKQKKPIERFLMMARLIRSQHESMKAGIRHIHPDFSEKELQECLRTKMMQIYSLKL